MTILIWWPRALKQQWLEIFVSLLSSLNKKPFLINMFNVTKHHICVFICLL